MNQATVQKKISLTIRKKLLGMSLILLFVPIVTLGLVSYKVSMDETDALIESKLDLSVNIILEMIANMDKSVKAGFLTEEEAKEQVTTMMLGELQDDGTRLINKNIDLGPNGYFFVIDETGTLLAHPRKEGENIWNSESNGVLFIQDLIKTAMEGGGVTYYQWPLPHTDGADNKEGKEALKVSYAKMAPEWGWIVATSSYMQDYDAGQKKIFESILVTLAGCLAIGSAALILFAQHIARPIRAITRRAEQIAQGDLRGEELNIRNRDEVGMLGQSFNQLTMNIRQLVGNLSLSSNILASSSDQLAHTIGSTKEAIHQTSTSIANVAMGNESQAQSTEETSRAMEEMAAGIGRVADASNEAYELSVQTLQEAKQGNTLIQQSTGQMNEIHGTMHDLGSVVSQLNGQSEQITEIVGTIQEISGQTNLLALNAAIEAARSGEHGRGFAVVAGEIRKLANRTNESVEQIASLIDGVRGGIDATYLSMQKGQREVEAGVQSIRDTGEAFARIVTAAETIVTQVQEASAAAEQMSASTEEVAASIQEIEKVALHSAGAAQTVSAAAEEQLAAMEEISGSAQKLRDMSLQMKSIVSQFNIG
ncbi:methyl-accepting chemotaxis protein [Paenibacillus sp. J5C_2022]|uniref:methyl-accepting chemotaxis protein n=1 Tax=Paenibacillus sp. J5C2022 TaxID=2977129 RepID=UPI0021CFB6AF|nr:methyl-accepting chemotaxis protein [Paenibacillus sp. J5C2022]MCU6707463.1 methyl-accepting chemotaxis protein [Paenibacillus sp. J5C2022]